MLFNILLFSINKQFLGAREYKYGVRFALMGNTLSNDWVFLSGCIWGYALPPVHENFQPLPPPPIKGDGVSPKSETASTEK